MPNYYGVGGYDPNAPPAPDPWRLNNPLYQQSQYSVQGGPMTPAFSQTGGLSDAVTHSGFGPGQTSAHDIGADLLRFGDYTYGKFEPLENWALNFFGDIAKGGGQYLNQLLGPGFSALSSQLPQAQRRNRDTTPLGGPQIEGNQRLEENLQGAQSQMASQVMNWGLGQLLDTGLGTTARIYPLLAAAGNIQKQPPKQGK